MTQLTLRRELERLSARWWPIDRQATLRMVVVLAVLAGAWVLGQRASLSYAVLLFGGIAVVLILRRPTWVLPGYVLAVAFVPWTLSVGGNGINVAILGAAGLGGLWALRMFLEKHVELRPSPANLPWALLCAAAGLSIVAGWAFWDPVVSVRSSFVLVQMAQWALFMLAALCYWVGANYPRSRCELRVLAWVVIGLGAVFVVQTLLPPSIASPLPYSEWTGPVARILFVAFGLGLALFDTSLKPMVRSIAALICMAVVIVAVYSGTDWMSGWTPPIVTSAAVTLLWVGIRSPRVAVSGGVAGALVAAGAFVWATGADLWSWQTRVVAWRGLLDLVGDRWLLGLGLGSYWHYWRSVIGSFSYLDPATGYLHVTTDPKVNMHNNYLDVFGQIGIVGLAIFIWLLVAIAVHAWRVYRTETSGFGKAYAAACLGTLAGMVFSGLLGDWVIPFVYNIGLNGFTEASVAWLLLGGVTVLTMTAGTDGADEQVVGVSENQRNLH